MKTGNWYSNDESIIKISRYNETNQTFEFWGKTKNGTWIEFAWSDANTIYSHFPQIAEEPEWYTQMIFHHNQENLWR